MRGCMQELSEGGPATANRTGVWKSFESEEDQDALRSKERRASERNYSDRMFGLKSTSQD